MLPLLGLLSGSLLLLVFSATWEPVNVSVVSAGLADLDSLFNKAPDLRQEVT